MAEPVKRVTLRPVVESDLAAFYAQQQDELASAMAAFPSRECELFTKHWHRIMRDPANVLRTVLCGPEVAGNMVSFLQDGSREVGYWLGRPYWSRGIATQGLRLFLHVVAERPLYAHVAKHNIGSRRVLEKCGFGILRGQRGEPIHPGGEPVDEYVMVLLPRRGGP